MSESRRQGVIARERRAAANADRPPGQRVANALRVLAVIASLGAAGGLGAQDLDLVLYAGDPSRRTLADQIEDPEERAAFETLRAATDAAEKRALAEQFLKRFPDSWFVSFAHFSAAMACIDLDDLQAALEHGERSLRILPENGTLQVALANVRVHYGLLDDARRGAMDALEMLARFQGPSHYEAAEWARTRRELEASAHFVLGRVAATRAFRQSGEEADAGLSSARASLLESLQLNPSDGIALLLLGIVEEGLGNREASLSAVEAAARLPGPAQARATDKLREAFRQRPGGAETFQDFRAAIRPLRPTGNGDGPAARDRNAAPAAYAGSESCRECHQQVYDAWRDTGMARMFRPYASENVIGDFSEHAEFRDPAGTLLSRMLVDGDRHFFELPADSGSKRFRVDYTIGSKWQQAYATRLPNGRIHVIPIQYNALHGRWVNFWETLDDGPSERSRVRDFHRMDAATSYQVHCSPCHTSQVQAEGSLVMPERMTFRESGINCEMCHGPSQGHAADIRDGRTAATEPTDPPLRFGQLDHRDYVEVCAQCHMQSAVIEPGPRGEINYTGRQAKFVNGRLQRPYDNYSRSAFYKDGRFRETTFIAEAFVRTQCYRQGQAHCGHCHDPHPADSADNPTSLKHRDDPNRMCLQCHAAPTYDVPAHTRHAAGSEASRCGACHMPKIMNSMMFMASTHRIDDIPDAAMTERFGPAESPNACLSCHADKPVRWLAPALAEWQVR